MKKFAIKAVILCLVTVIPYLWLQYRVIRYNDAHYHMLTHKGNAVITGLSRAKRIPPRILQQELNPDHIWQNLALSNTDTPYGQPYYEYLKQKMLLSETPANHIVVVAGTSIMVVDNSYKGKREAQSLLYNSEWINTRYNIPYFFKKPALRGMVNTKLVPAITGQKGPNVVNHENGWTEVIVPKGYSKRSNVLGNFGLYIPSPEREAYLKKTIDLLKTSGHVFLVRMPVSSGAVLLEHKHFPDLDAKIEQLAFEKSVPYLNYLNEGNEYNYSEIPGDHLVSASAQQFARKLAQDIKGFLEKE